MIFQEKCFSCYILSTDQILLSDYLYVLWYWTICVLQLGIAVVTSEIKEQSLISVLLELQMKPFPLTYQTFAILMLRFNLFLQSLKLPLLLSFLFLLIKNMHLLLLLGLLTLLVLHVLVLPLLQHFLFHHRRTLTELFQFLLPFYLPILWLVLLTL